MNTRFTSQFKGDKWIWSIVVILSLIGILAVYSSTGALAYSEQKGDTEWYFLRHTRFLLIGLVLLYITHHIPFQYYARISQIFLLISIGLLFSTWFIGSELNNATRVLPIPLLGITFQPSDMAKLFLVMYIARYLSKNQAEIDSPRVFWTTLTYILVVVLLIAPENLSTALVVFLTCSLLMFIGRVNVKYLLFLLFSGLGLLSFFVVVLLNINTANLEHTRIPTWKQRIETFTGLDKGEGEGNYQQLQSKIAVSSGGILGKGPGNSTQRNYLPHSYSDFIYATIIEEYGLLGGLLVMGCFLVLIYRCLKIVVESP
ncbi:MAG: FtsW/RodA/SpoVE family cell cycle protein, partial [Bacteroidetes bacterium]|nr:FtsW/RodA/SpoVE family cell cycle protein [Bacteroidota bacterium]